MNEQKLIASLKKKIVSPRIYAIEMISGAHTYLYLSVAHTFEEAFSKCLKQLKERFDKQNKVFDRATVAMGKYISIDLEEAITECIEFSIENNITDKNILMKKIIDTKDVELFHENLTIFTEHEKTLINEKLTSK